MLIDEPAPAANPGRQSSFVPGTGGTFPGIANAIPGFGSTASVTPPSNVLPPTQSTRQAAAKPTSPSDRDITGSVAPAPKPQAAAPVASAAPPQPAAANKPASVTAIVPPAGPPIPAPPAHPNPAPAAFGADKLPAAFGAELRAAAAKGDPAAQYEVAARFAEGRGVPQNLTEAVEWFERAAKQGLVPAQFRLGGLYEKGLGVKKNLETARRLYVSAGEAGNAKALHNLAVLYAEGIDGKPDYQTAAKWFRKAADLRRRRQPVQSRHSLCARHRRRAEPGGSLSVVRAGGARRATRTRSRSATIWPAASIAQSLAAAQQAVESFRPEPQPEAATEVKAPPGGWDAAGRRRAGRRQAQAARGRAQARPLDPAAPSVKNSAQ